MCHGHKRVFIVIMAALLLGACAKPALQASEQILPTKSRLFVADPNQTYYAIRWALASTGYPVGQEDLPRGVINTSWIPTRALAFYLDPFDRQSETARDYGDNAGYYQLELQVSSEDGKTRVTITPHVKSLLASLKSSGRQEDLVLNRIGDYLRSSEPDVTNVGIGESK